MPQVQGGLIHCGRCGKTYSNPFTHICRARIGKRPGKTRFAPKVKVALAKCAKCGQPYSNPLTHACTVKTDFAKRKKAAAAKPKHPEPEDCEEGPDCQAYGCRMFWRGYGLGRQAGYEDGYDTGHVEGYEKGHTDGHAEGYQQGYNDGHAAGAASAS